MHAFILLMDVPSPWITQEILLEILWNYLCFNKSGQISSWTPTETNTPTVAVEWNTASLKQGFISILMSNLLVSYFRAVKQSLKPEVILLFQPSKSLKYLIHYDIK